jgi:two-component system CheB/CheR fusion protein
VLGSAESIGDAIDYFHLLDSKHRIYAKKMAPLHGLLDFTRLQHPFQRHPVAQGRGAEPVPVFDPSREADRLLLDRIGPPSVLVNGDFNILHFRGNTGLYLTPAAGPASLNLLKMAREGLMVVLHTAVQEAGATREPVYKRAIRFRSNGEFKEVSLQVIPLSAPGGARDVFYLVLFERPGGPQAALPELAPPVAPEKPSGDEEKEQLRSELASTKDYLQSVIASQEVFNEELRSANEEILSSNEELQSTNEELETAKEELQSANEELTTLNEELQTRNRDLAKVNDDLNNLLGSVSIGIIIVDNEIRVRRFTPLSAQLMNLIPTDIGRPLGDINPRINLPGLSEVIREVIDSLSPLEVKGRDGRGDLYSVRVRPYRTQDNRIDGALITLAQADSAQEVAARADGLINALASCVDNALVVITDGMHISTANSTFRSMFKLDGSDIDQLDLLELVQDQLDRESLRRLLEQELGDDGAAKEIVLARKIDGTAPRRLRIRAQRIVDRIHPGAAAIVQMEPLE